MVCNDIFEAVGWYRVFTSSHTRCRFVSEGCIRDGGRETMSVTQTSNDRPRCGGTANDTSVPIVVTRVFRLPVFMTIF